MNIVDALTVTLGLDSSGFTKGQKDAAAAQAKLKADGVASAKSIEDANAKAGESVAALGRKFLGLYVLLTAGKGVQQFVSEITAADAALGRTAKNLDMSGRNLSAWQNAATVAGGSAEGITGTLRGLTSEMQKAALTGQSSIIPVFRALGINLADASGKARDAGDVLVDLNRKAQGMDPARFTELAHMAGIDDGTITLLEKTTAEFDKLRAEQQKYAATANDIDAAQKRQSGWRQLLITSQSLGRTILTSLTPAITAAMEAVQKWADANQDWIKTKVVEYAERFSAWFKSVDWSKVGADLATIAANVASVASALATAVSGVDGNSTLFKAFEAFGAMLAVSVIGRIAGVASAIAGLGSVALPGWMARMLGLGSLATALPLLGTAAVGAVLASGDPNKALLDGGRPDVQPQDNDLGLPGVGDRTSDTTKSKGLWDSFKKAIGWGDRLHDDGKVKDGIEDTAKATGEIRDILKAQKDGLGADGVSSGGIGGSGNHVGGTGNPGGGGTGFGARLGDHARGGIGRGAAAMAPNARESFEFWKSKGLTPEQAAGLAGMEQGESGFNPRSVGDSGQAHGAFQWHADRRAAIRASTGIDIDTATHAQQLEAAYWEFQHKEAGAWAAIKRSKTASDAARAGVYLFERPGDKEGQSIVRGGMAEGWLKRFNEEDAKGKGKGDGASHTEPTVTVNGTPSHNDAPVSDDVYHAAKRVAEQAKGMDPSKMSEDQRRAVGLTKGIIDRYEKAHPTTPTAAPPVTHGRHGTYEAHGKALPAWMSPGADGPIMTVDHRNPNFAPHPLDAAHQKLADAMNAAAHPVTVDHAVRHVLKALAQARHLTAHNDNHPVPVTMGDKTVEHIGKRTFGAYLDYAKKHQDQMPHVRDHVAALDRMTRMAANGGSMVHHTVNHNTDTRIGEMNVHPKGDGKQFASEFQDGMRSDRAYRGDVVQSNGALA